MKTVSAQLAAHLAGEVTTLATCWRLERTDGWVRGFTDHDRNLVIEGVTYVAATGLSVSLVILHRCCPAFSIPHVAFFDSGPRRSQDVREFAKSF